MRTGDNFCGEQPGFFEKHSAVLIFAALLCYPLQAAIIVLKTKECLFFGQKEASSLDFFIWQWWVTFVDQKDRFVFIVWVTGVGPENIQILDAFDILGGVPQIGRRNTLICEWPLFCTSISPEHDPIPLFFVLNPLCPVKFLTRVFHLWGVVGVHQEDRRVVPWVESFRIKSFWSNPIILLFVIQQRFDKNLLVRMTDCDGLCLWSSRRDDLLEKPSIDEAVAQALGGRAREAFAHCLVQTLLLAKPCKRRRWY